MQNILAKSKILIVDSTSIKSQSSATCITSLNAKKDLKVGDVITSINGKPLKFN